MLARIKLFDQLGFFFICMQNTAWSDRGQTSAIENGLRCPTISIYSQNNEKIVFDSGTEEEHRDNIKRG